jgi:hypothetical protein
MTTALTAHRCHARGCGIAVPPTMLMCRTHWWKVPKRVRDAVWSSYRRGQCDDGRPSAEWLEAASAAIGYVAQLEGQKFSVSEARAMVALGVANQTVRDGLARIDARADAKKDDARRGIRR